MKKAPTVTKDISSDYKKLKALRNKGIIKIIGIKIENNADKIGGTGSYWRWGRINAYSSVNAATPQ